MSELFLFPPLPPPPPPPPPPEGERLIRLPGGTVPVVEACSDCSRLARESVADGLLVDEGVDTKWAVGNVLEGSVFDSGVRGVEPRDTDAAVDPDGSVTLAEGEA